MTPGPGVEHVLQYDHDVVTIRNQTKNDFLDAFDKGRESYVSGDWINAQTALNMALAIQPFDGPSKWLLNYLEKNKVLPPEDWNGIRDIDRKMDAPVFDYNG